MEKDPRHIHDRNEPIPQEFALEIVPESRDIWLSEFPNKEMCFAYQEKNEKLKMEMFPPIDYDELISEYTLPPEK